MGVKFNFLGEEFIIVMKKVFGTSGFTRSTPRNLRGNKNPTLPQAKAQWALASTAHSNIGKMGTTNGIPTVAYAVQQQVAQGTGVHGGLSKDQRLATKRVSAQRLQRLQTRAMGVERPIYEAYERGF